MKMDKIEHRAVIKYLFLKGNTLTQIKDELDSVSLNNLSHTDHMSKEVHLEDVISAVKKTLTKYFYEAHYQDYDNIYNLHKSLVGTQESSAVMQSEKIILCEINACLWVKAFTSAINSITKKIYPHYLIAEKFINFILNSDSNENFGMIEEYFWKLLQSHPPKPEMFDYYWKILSDHFVILNDEKPEDQTVLFCLLEEISNNLKNKSNFDRKNPLEPEFSGKREVNCRTIFETKSLEASVSDTKVQKKVVYYIDLPWNEQIKRCLMALSFIYDILKTDFIFWLHSKKLKPNLSDSRPLLSWLLWPNVRDIGLINKELRKVLDLYDAVLKSSSVEVRSLKVVEKLVTLVGEVIRCSDFIEGIKYPFVGKKCDNFFRELSVILHQRLVKSEKNFRENELLVNFRPPWLRFFLCCRLLTLITEHQCPFDLTGVYDILEYIAHTKHHSKNSTNLVEKKTGVTNSRLIRKFKTSCKSINAKLKNVFCGSLIILNRKNVFSKSHPANLDCYSSVGKTHLHIACEENDTEKIKALLTFPDINVNAVDRDGWTALHTAAFKGNEASVKELLSFYPKSKETKKCVNTRARGPESITPLMSGAIGGHAKVCQLLLEHSGSVLLEDVNELNQTTLELSNVPDVLEILHYYKNNKVWTPHSRKDINFDIDLKELVLKLCVEMIQAYFCTYRTWDVYKALKRTDINAKEKMFDLDLEYKWDYMCYHRDIKRNINKLKKLIPDLALVAEFNGLYETYVKILTLHKNF